jgi:hypothetical protein
MVCMMALLAEHRLDDLVGLGFREAALAQEGLAVLVLAGDDGFTGRLDASHERHGR